MLVLDYANGAIAFVVTPQLKVARTIRMPLQTFPLLPLTWPRLAVTAGMVSLPTRAGWPLHLLSMNGSDAAYTTSFGVEKGTTDPGRGAQLAQRLSTAADGGFWSVDATLYRFSKWSSGGALQGVCTRAPAWFATGGTGSNGTPTSAPPPHIQAIREAPDGLIWVYYQLAAPTWREAWPKLPGQSELRTKSLA